jgi:hypothetical protein
VPFGKIREKFRKSKNPGYLLVMCVLTIVLCFHLVVLRLDTSYPAAVICTLDLDWTIANLLSLIANPCCHIVSLPIAPHILLSAQFHLATVIHAQQQIASPCLVSSKLPKTIRKIKKKNCQSFCMLFKDCISVDHIPPQL